MKKNKRRHTPTAAELRAIRPPIPDTPANVARALLTQRPKTRWRFLEEPASKQETV